MVRTIQLQVKIHSEGMNGNLVTIQSHANYDNMDVECSHS